MRRFRDTSDTFKKTCVWAFEKRWVKWEFVHYCLMRLINTVHEFRLTTQQLNYNSPNKGELGKFAFEAVDKVCKNMWVHFANRLTVNSFQFFFVDKFKMCLSFPKSIKVLRMMWVNSNIKIFRFFFDEYK